jgi:hypothetical protein
MTFLETIKEETKDEIFREYIFENTAPHLFDSIESRAQNIYPILPEIHFGEVPFFEQDEPSWYASHPVSYTHEEIRALYDQWYGTNHDYEPLEDIDFEIETISYIATKDYSANWK